MANIAADERMAEPSQADVTMHTVSARFIGILLGCYFVAYIDRVNVSFAALTANADLGLSPSAFGLGSGLFFVGYFLAEVPSNLVLDRVGARYWLARIMFTMGVIAMAMSLVTGAKSFYVLRFLLGVAEAGLFPGIIVFMRAWYPKRYKANYIALFMLAIPLSSFLGSPISGALLSLDGLLGLKGWQWLYVLEGLPCIVLAVLIWRYLTDKPREADWLTAPQREWLQATMETEKLDQAGLAHSSPFKLLTDSRVWAYSAAFFGITAGSYGLSLWLPQIVKEFGLSNLQTGFISAVPFGFGCVATVWWGRRSDRTGERVWHTAIAAICGAVGLGACLVITSPTLELAALSVAAMGIFGIRGPFWALLSERFPDSTAAGGIAMVSAIASLAGFGGPYVVGWIKEATGGFAWGLFLLAILSLIGGLIVILRARYEQKQMARA